MNYKTYDYIKTYPNNILQDQNNQQIKILIRSKSHQMDVPKVI